MAGPWPRVQLARMAGSATLITALGDDELAERSRGRLAELGVEVEAAIRDEPTRRGLTILDSHGERTIITIGDRLAPRGRDPLDWSALEGTDGVYFTAGDEGALRAARAAAGPGRNAPGRRGARRRPGWSSTPWSTRQRMTSNPASRRRWSRAPRCWSRRAAPRAARYETSDGRTGTWAAAPAPRAPG